MSIFTKTLDARRAARRAEVAEQVLAIEKFRSDSAERRRDRPLKMRPQSRAESIAQRFMMTTNVTEVHNQTVSFAGQSHAANGLALVRLTIGAMFVWVFFENLGKGTYSPAGYAGLINYYIKTSHSPPAWKAVMGLMANHAALAAPMQAMTEISVGILLVLGLLTRPAAFVAFLFLASLWVSEWGTAWIWELLVPVLASLGLAVGHAGRTWGLDALLARRRPSSPWW
jgi:uncharacterized membrane protein YphA (DoxX/SURF4 family)